MTKETEDPIDFDSPRSITAYLHEHNIALKKRWGQNFMVNRSARERIVAVLDPKASETVWEVGPGLGAMTGELASRAGLLRLFEIDWGLIRHLQAIFPAGRNVQIVTGDVLDTWYEVYRTEGAPDALFGNLPYRSAAMLIGSMLEKGVVPGRMVFTVQKEVAARMAARPGTDDYSGFSVLCQAHCTVEVVGELQPGSFFPAPEVVSSIVRLVHRVDVNPQPDPERFALLVRSAFAARRKTIGNNLGASVFGREIGKQELLRVLTDEGISPGERAERLSPEMFAALALRLRQAGSAQ